MKNRQKREIPLTGPISHSMIMSEWDHTGKFQLSGDGHSLIDLGANSRISESDFRGKAASSIPPYNYDITAGCWQTANGMREFHCSSTRSSVAGNVMLQNTSSSISNYYRAGDAPLILVDIGEMIVIGATGMYGNDGYQIGNSWQFGDHRHSYYANPLGILGSSVSGVPANNCDTYGSERYAEFNDRIGDLLPGQKYGYTGWGYAHDVGPGNLCAYKNLVTGGANQRSSYGIKRQADSHTGKEGQWAKGLSVTTAPFPYKGKATPDMVNKLPLLNATWQDCWTLGFRMTCTSSDTGSGISRGSAQVSGFELKGG